jgi:predicted DNA-binding transcriptional regulator YafY
MSGIMQAKAPPLRGAFSPVAAHSEPDSPHLRLPLVRLLELVMILQSERFPNARQLAEICGVSRRTIYRDLTCLETAGLRVLYVPERQGYQLGSECLLQPPQLDEHEALALLVASHVGSIPDPFGSLLPVRRALTKVFHSLPGDRRDELAEGGELIAPSAPASEAPEERRSIHQAILDALLHRQRLRLWYRDGGQGPVSTTNFGLYRLARLEGQWALVGHSSADDGVRLYWLPWLERAEATGEAYAIPPRFQLERFLAKQQPNRRDRATEVHLRFSAKLAAVVRDMPERSGQKKRPGPDGTLELVLNVERFDEIVHWVLSFGDQVEIIEPDELRKAVCDWAEQIIRRHSAGSD